MTESTNAWLKIVGIGEDGWEGLNPQAKQAIESADILYGGERHLALIPKNYAARRTWPSPMAPAVHHILTELRGQQVTVLASGDPMLHGVGATLTRNLSPEEFRVIPHVSAFTLACARLGWPSHETTLISLVHRAPEELLRHLYPNHRLIVFSADGTTPATVAQLLTKSGYGPSQLHVFENMGGPTGCAGYDENGCEHIGWYA